MAAMLLGAAQLAFLAGLLVAGWALALAVAIAAGIALSGCCVSCLLYTQFKLHRALLRDLRGVERTGTHLRPSFGSSYRLNLALAMAKHPPCPRR